MDLPILKRFSAKDRFAGRRILVVDDEEDVCKLLFNYLARRGYQVACATTAAQTLSCVQESPFDLVILDLVMADVEGFGLLDALKSAHPELPILVLTGVGFQEDILREAQQKGADGYLTKALSMEDLLLEIHRILKFR